MFSSLRKLALVIGAAAALVGCAGTPQGPVSLASSTLGPKTGKVGVAMTTMAKPDLHLPGAGCLLCLAFATAANSKLNEYSKTLSTEDLMALRKDAVAALSKKGVEAVEIQEEIKLDDLPSARGSLPNSTDRDFASIRQRYQIERLVVFSINVVGTQRPYASYIPTGDGKAVVQGRGFMVDLTNNTYQWYAPVNVLLSSSGAWDEPPSFPGLTNAYYQAVEATRDQLLKPLGK